MLELEKLKSELFPDYEENEDSLKDLKSVTKSSKSRLSLDNKRLKLLNGSSLAKIDDPTIPISYSGVTDNKERITHKTLQVKRGNGSSTSYVESFINSYYEPIKEKQNEMSQKKNLTEDERVRQLGKIRGPSSGFYLCKASKNPTLFESNLYEL